MPPRVIDTPDGRKVYDRLRRRFVALTPEEWVRQKFVDFLIEELGYPQGLMANEVGIRLNATLKRCDTVVYDRHGRPLVIVEYKAPTVRITQEVFDQITRYNIIMKAPYLMVSNGAEHYCCRIDTATREVTFLTSVPRYPDLTHGS